MKLDEQILILTEEVSNSEWAINYHERKLEESYAEKNNWAISYHSRKLNTARVLFTALSNEINNLNKQ